MGRHGSRLRCLLAAFGLVLFTGEVEAFDVDGDFYFDETTPTPKAVLALQDCDADEKTAAHRKPFADGFIFAVQCASNNENFMETLIFSEQEDGSGGWLLKFPRPAKLGGTDDVLSNIRWYLETKEIGDLRRP